MRLFTKRKLAFYLNILVIIAAFLLSIWPKSATVRIYLPTYWRPFIGFSAIWLSVAIFSGKYNFDLKKNFAVNLMRVFRSDVYSLAVILFLLYFFHVFHFSRLVVLGTVLFSFAMESSILAIWYYSQKFKKDSDVATYLDAPATVYEESEHVPVRKFVQLPESDTESVLSELKQIWLKDDISLFQFIKDNTQIRKIPASKTKVMFTHHLYNIKHVTPSTQLLFVNLHELNGWSQINLYLRQVNSNLQVGGYFVSCGEDYRHKHRRYYKTYPMFLATLVTIFDYIFRRIFQRIPGIRELYYAVFHDSQKPFSQCELLGRVAFSGFDIIDVQEKDNLFYFIAQKITSIPQLDNPIYGPFIGMKRIGQKGKEIYLYKMRTMFPYAEFLQEFIYHKNKLKKSGKFNNDFRIMPGGKFLRRTWIDELPQFYNFLKGEIKLVGVRAISPQYFSLYPEEAKKKRVQVKPGIIPPFYVDMPKTFQEIVDSEMRYIEAYKKNPFFTDIKYLFKAFYNIIFHHARSS